MAPAKMSDTVVLHYTGSFTDGEIFDSSLDREPFEFTIGQGMVISGLEKGIVGMNEGELRTLNIPAEEAYGLRREDLLAIIGRSQMPANIDLKIGIVLQARAPDGGVTSVMVRDVNDENVTLDFNHPLAGKELIFEVNLIKISPAI
jgi:FKBP-type peptidyl-prolyl cis-trans isomerase 2